MQLITLENIQSYLDDPQALKRGYVFETTIKAAYEISENYRITEFFGKPGYGGNTGCPHDWYMENCPKYSEWSNYFDGLTFANRKWRYVCELTDLLLKND